MNLHQQQLEARIGLALDGEYLEIFNRIRSGYPPGHCPKPALSAVAFRNRVFSQPEPLEYANGMQKNLEAKWKPAWGSGRMVPDLHNWITDYDPDADIGPVNGKPRDLCTCTWEAADANCPVHREQLRRMA